MAAPKLTEEQELAILFPEPIDFTIGKVVIPVAPMDTIACARFAARARPIIRTALDSGQAFATDDAGLENVLAAIIVAAMDYPTELLDALAIATGRPADFLGKLPPSATASLARLVFQVNADFFVQSAGLLGSGALATEPAKAAPAPGAGQTH